MIRVLFFLAVLVLLAVGEAWLVEHPGELTFHFHGYTIETTALMGIAAVLVVAALLVMAWSALRFTFKVPSLMAVATRGQSREKGFAALSRGMIAVGEGDVETARRAAVEAQRKLPGEPLALLLKAQAAQLAGDRSQAEGAFKEMSKRNDMRLLGLRGLHVEAERRGDAEAAHGYAEQARELTLLPWTAQENFDHKVAAGDWRGALALLEKGSDSRHLDKQLRDRDRGVLETAIALETADARPSEALSLARSALKHAPGFEPALALAARLTAEAGDPRKAEKLIEGAWAQTPHPDLAKIYLGLYPGESDADRRKRALALAQRAPREPDSKLLVAETALEARDYEAAREAMQPLVDGPERPTARMCRLMAELEEKQHGAQGYVREWLTRASHAPRDPIWIADGVVSEKWRPISPVTGKLDAFVWKKPLERLPTADEAEDAVFAPLVPPEPPLLLEEPEAAAAADRSASPPTAPAQREDAPKQNAAAPSPAKPKSLADLFKA